MASHRRYRSHFSHPRPMAKSLLPKAVEPEDKYKLLSEQAGEAIFTFDLEGHVVYVNKAGAKLLSLPAGRIVRSHFKKNIDKASLSKAWNAFARVKQGVPMLQVELNIRDSAQQLIPIEFTASPIYQDGRIIEILVITRDIGRRKELERLLREAEKMKALGSVISGTVQEVQVPLKKVVDDVQGLIAKYKNRDFEFISYKEYKEIMQSLEGMCDQLKDCYARASKLMALNQHKAGPPKGYSNVNMVVKETVKTVSRDLDDWNISLKSLLGENIPLAKINPSDLAQVITNILTNAVESIPQKGEVQVKTFYHKPENVIHIICQDTGAGIPRENLPRVFDPFFTTKAKGDGKSQGLGLSIVYSILKACHGDISITSTLHNGTTVNVVLPVFPRGKGLKDKNGPLER